VSNRPISLLSMAVTLVGAVLLLAACGDTTPLWGPNSPRNGAQQPVDPIYGTPIPGYPLINGGRN
jgi:hypothetical protein